MITPEISQQLNEPCVHLQAYKDLLILQQDLPVTKFLTCRVKPCFAVVFCSWTNNDRAEKVKIRLKEKKKIFVYCLKSKFLVASMFFNGLCLS
jgi:hypothetical protein